MAFIKEFADKMGYVGDERMLLSANATLVHLGSTRRGFFYEGGVYARRDCPEVQ